MATGTTQPRRKPVDRGSETGSPGRGPARARGAKAKRPAAPQRRWAPPHDIDGPKVRLGLAWFGVATLALLIGPLATALAFGLAAAAGAAQAARCWRRRGLRPNELVAAGMAGAVAVGASLGAGGAGLAILGGVAVAAFAAGADVRSRQSTLTDAGITIQCALPLGVAAMSMVLLTRLDRGSAVALLLLISAYDAGDFVFGSASAAVWDGPAVGVISMLALTPVVAGLPISGLGFVDACALGVAAAVAAPVGQVLGSAILPSAAGPASALRRIDTLLLAAPMWAWGVGLLLTK
jgi:hypothetical protein